MELSHKLEKGRTVQFNSFKLNSILGDEYESVWMNKNYCTGYYSVLQKIAVFC